MIKVTVKKKNNIVYEIVTKGHANFDEYGKDIVCAAVSTMITTTINDIIALDDSISYEINSGFLKIRVEKNTDISTKLLNNLVRMLEELKSQYPKNIEIRNED